MKRRESAVKRKERTVTPGGGAEPGAALAQVLALIDDPEDVQDFLVDLCTPAELEALADRWSVVPLLDHGVSYRSIHEQTGVSVTTIGRVARWLDHGTGGYRAALLRHTAGA